MSYTTLSQAEIKTILSEARRIAIVGLSNKPERVSYRIATLLQEKGYEIIPVNPVLTGETILGVPVVARLQDIDGPVDIVDVFRKSEYLPEVAQEFIEMDGGVFWAQLGLESATAFDLLQQAGCQKIVMDRCIKLELAD